MLHILYHSASHTALGLSDHCLIHFIPTYRPQLKCAKLVDRTVKRWIREGVKDLRSSLTSTSWITRRPDRGCSTWLHRQCWSSSTLLSSSPPHIIHHCQVQCSASSAQLKRSSAANCPPMITCTPPGPNNVQARSSLTHPTLSILPLLNFIFIILFFILIFFIVFAEQRPFLYSCLLS